MTSSAKHDALIALQVLLLDVKNNLTGCNHADLLLDLAILRDRVKTRGLTILMDDLPKLGKLYDKGLSDERIDWKAVPHTLKVGHRVLFSSLLYWSFRYTGEFIKPEADVVFFTRCILYLYKKVEEKSSDQTNRKAIEDFYSIDSEVRLPTTDWTVVEDYDSHSFEYRVSFTDVEDTELSTWDRTLLHSMDVASRLFCPVSRYIDWDDYRPKHGPGAVSDLPSGGDKYTFPSWPATLSRVFPSNGWASHVHDCTDDSLPDSWGETTPSSKLICVPKTLSKPRVIASEPTAHMYCQQAILTYLRQNMPPVACHMIDFHDQSPSRDLALEASRTGDLATVDLSSASDRLSCWVVERFFELNLDLLDALKATRTRYVTSAYRDAPYELRKFAPMGSAVTFPVQSMVYAAAVVAAKLATDYTSVMEKKQALPRGVVDSSCRATEYLRSGVRVFGDDIILPKKYYPALNRLLTLLGLVVNSDKTHTTGNFRESCGMDAYQGSEVTPLYLSALGLGRAVVQVPSWVAVSDNAHKCGLWSLSSWMVDQIDKSFLKRLPISHDDLGCVRLFTFNKSSHRLPSKKRWNDDWQRFDYHCLVVQARSQVESRHDWYDLLQYFIEGSKQRLLAYLDPALTRVGHHTDYRTRVVVRWVGL